MDKLSRERQAWSSDAIRGGHASGEEGMLVSRRSPRDARPNLPVVHHAPIWKVKTLEELSA